MNKFCNALLLYLLVDFMRWKHCMCLSASNLSELQNSLNTSSFQRNRKIYPLYFCVVEVVSFPLHLLDLLQLIYNCFGTGNFFLSWNLHVEDKVNKVFICLLFMFRRNQMLSVYWKKLEWLPTKTKRKRMQWSHTSGKLSLLFGKRKIWKWHRSFRSNG